MTSPQDSQAMALATNARTTDGIRNTVSDGQVTTRTTRSMSKHSKENPGSSAQEEQRERIQEDPRPNFLHTFLYTFPGEIRNLIYENLAPRPWGYVDITRFDIERFQHDHGGGAFAQFHPTIASEYRGYWCPNVTFMWIIGLHSQPKRGAEPHNVPHDIDDVDFEPWHKWIKQFDDVQAGDIESVRFRLEFFEVKVTISVQKRVGEKFRVEFTVQQRCGHERLREEQPFDGLQQELDGVADSGEQRKEMLNRVAMAVVGRVRMFY
ncbi:hypothetical protein CLAFUW4_10910 [Fulvia fulva]|nr:hypothetical protein CLAFUR4_10915 [Fulvia fulva]KAK4620466.1 hypothetical protein CLAFUR0_10922 [Fulvia fulva]WPV17314.1 hypothetical protein CLAFUW4_10910 [Fulvia fulva]WPV31992.1 hypothetical protein CLAFUW7_10908 [Fulvia fulva]